MNGNPTTDMRQRRVPTDSSADSRGVFDRNNCYDYGSANEYASAVRAWLAAYHNWNLAQLLTPLYFQQIICQQPFPVVSFPGASSSTTSPTSLPAQQSPFPTSSNANVTEAAQRNRYIVPAFGRRVIAEMIDFAICFMLSLFVTYVCVELDLIELNRYEKLLSDQADMKTLIDVTQDLFPVEVVKKLLVSVIEAVYLSYGIGLTPAGSTPGKFVMGLKVIPCVSVQPVAPRDYRVIVEAPSESLSFQAALLRSLIKNFAVSFLFPLCVIMYVFRFNRALYDIAAGTIVVEV